ncbi:phosphoribosyltransferase [Larkinella sp. GY13]|uniref:phosphoribosyltransferase n=1 Tax=Larkinella sp. GY13 TaxID=3453720 RepID=UPI003EE8BC10
MIFSILPDDKDVITSLGTYHPYRKGANPNWDDFSARILDIKNNKPYGITFFEKQLQDILADENFTIVIVPSHDPANTEGGMKALVQRLCNDTERIDGTGCLVRHTKVEKSSTGGGRSIEKHLQSINVKNVNLISGRQVLILDDVTTTGSSLIACRQLIKKCGPSLIVTYALAQTAQFE